MSLLQMQNCIVKQVLFIPARHEWTRQRHHLARGSGWKFSRCDHVWPYGCPSGTFTDSRSLRYKVLLVAESTAGLEASMEGQMLISLNVQLCLFHCVTSEGKTSWQSLLVINAVSQCPLDSSAHILDSVTGKSQFFPHFNLLGDKKPAATSGCFQTSLCPKALMLTNKLGCFRRTLLEHCGGFDHLKD